MKMRYLLALALLALASPAFAQNNLTVKGAVAANDCVKFFNKFQLQSTGAPCSAGGTSLTDSASLRSALSDEVGTGAAYFVGGALGTPASATGTNFTGIPIAGLTGLGTGVGTALGVNIGSAGAPVLFNGAGGTPSSLTLTNATGLPNAAVIGLTSAATTSIGTSGATIPLLSTANTWSLTQTLSVAINTPIGSNSTPSVQIGGTNTGWYSSSANTIVDLALGGVQLYRFATSGFIMPTNLPTILSSGGCYDVSSGTAGVNGADAFLCRDGTGNWRLGAADAGSPVAQVISVQDVAGGTLNTAGVDTTFEGSKSTGNAAGGSFVFKTVPAHGSDSAQGTSTARLTVNTTGIVLNGGSTITALTEGTWLPTAGANTNVAASTFSNLSYIRLGKKVIFWGDVAIDPTAAGNTALHITLGAGNTSDFAAIENAGGTGCASQIAVGNGPCFAISADVAADDLVLAYQAGDTANRTFFLSGGYTILP